MPTAIASASLCEFGRFSLGGGLTQAVAGIRGTCPLSPDSRPLCRPPLTPSALGDPRASVQEGKVDTFVGKFLLRLSRPPEIFVKHRIDSLKHFCCVVVEAKSPDLANCSRNGSPRWMKKTQRHQNGSLGCRGGGKPTTAFQ